MRSAALALIRLYQLLVSPLLPPACRFYPSCSQYAATAIAERGLIRGGAMALARLARCNPWHPGGVDFVPQEPLKKSLHRSQREVLPQIAARLREYSQALYDRGRNKEMRQNRRCPKGLPEKRASALSKARAQTVWSMLPRLLLAPARFSVQTIGTWTSSEVPK